jgi:hypothetical protein
MATVEQQQQEIESLTQQLAEARMSGDPETLRRKDQRIKELTEALHQARGQTGAVINVDALEQENSALSQQNDRLRLELERAQVAAEEARRQVEELVSRAGIEGQASAAAASQFQAERDELMQKIFKLEADLKQAQAQVQALASRRRQGEAAASQQSSQRERRVRELVDHLRRRHRRLQRVKALLRERAAGVRPAPCTGEVRAAPARATVTTLAHEQAQLEEARQKLAAAEKRMARRSAAPRAIVVVGWLLLLLGLNAGGAWLAANLLHPPQLAASVTLVAATETGGPIAAEELEKWVSWHAQRVEDARFLAPLARRMADLRLDRYGSAEVLESRLSQDLTIDSAEPGRLTLSLAGTDKEESLAILDLLASGLASRSKQEAGRLPKAVHSVVEGERTEGGRSRSATMNPVPIEDRRLERAVPIFGVSVAATLTLVLLVARTLGRARRMLETDALLAEPELV